VKKKRAKAGNGNAGRQRRPVHGKTKTARRTRSGRSRAVAAVPVTTADLRELRRQLIKAASSRPPTNPPGSSRSLRWNPEPEEVQRSVAQLVLTLVEFLRRLMERRAIRRMERRTLTAREVEAVGIALMRLEQTIREIGKRFGLTPEDLNLDLGPVGKLM
jgi:hypothetical protein